MKRTNKSTVIIIFGVVIIIILFASKSLVSVFTSFDNFSLTKEERERKNAIIENDYLKLFDSLEYIEKDYKLITKLKHPFAFFRYKRDYRILIHKINLNNEKNLDELINIEQRKAKKSTGINYQGLEIANFEFLYSSENDSVADKIYLTYNKSIIKKSRINDSLFYLKFLVNDLSVRYQPNGVSDHILIIKEENILQKIPRELEIELVLVKRSHSIYFIYLYNLKKYSLSKDGMIFNLIK